MYDVVLSKFTHNPELKALLIKTGDAYLEETNTWHDTYWGVCNGKGLNNLCSNNIHKYHIIISHKTNRNTITYGIQKTHNRTQIRKDNYPERAYLHATYRTQLLAGKIK